MPLGEIAQGIMGVSNTEVSQEYENMKQVAKHYLETLEEAAMALCRQTGRISTPAGEAIAPYAHNPAYQAFWK